jgi:hypothetical protein
MTGILALQESSPFPLKSLLLLLAAFLSWSKPAMAATSIRDLGLQQVVEVKERRWGAKAGYQFSILGRSSPFFNDEPITAKAKSLVMVNSAYLNTHFGNHAFGSGIMRYTAGAVFSRTNHLQSFIDWIDHDAQTAFLEASIYTQGNWVTRFGMRGARLVTLQNGETQFSEIAPMLSIAKVYYPGTKHYLSIQLSGDYSLSDSIEIPGTSWTSDRLNHWTVGLQFQHSWMFTDSLSLNSFAGASYNGYGKGINKDRTDKAYTTGTSLQWAFLRFFTVAGYGEFLSRDSSLGTYSFSNWDGGLKFNASIGY